jgi:peroxiredoxin
MSNQTPNILLPRHPVPALDLPLTTGERFVLGAQPAERLAPEFAARGVNLVAISSDTEERGQEMARKVSASGVHFAHSLPLKSAREWGLYISESRGKTSIGIDEPALFSEPAVYLVRPDGTLYYGAVQTMPFARPAFTDLLGAIDFAISKDYPARGEYTGAV